VEREQKPPAPAGAAMASRGVEGWHRAQAQNYGPERWELLRQALHRDVEHVCFANPWLSPEARARLEREYVLGPTSIPGAFTFELPEDPLLQYAVAEGDDESCVFVEPESEDKRRSMANLPPGPNLAPFFFVDGANAIAALALRPDYCDRVLVACAGPGGAALVLASALFAQRLDGDNPPEGTLVINEVAKEAASRFRRTAQKFLPQTLFDDIGQGPRIIFTSADPGTPSNSMERSGPYDKILLQAPSTVDRDLLRSGGLEQWSAAKGKVSSERQVKWLHNALWMLKEGGVILFSSCALSPEECDGVVERLLLKARGTFELEVLPLEQETCSMVPGLAAESTDWGARILPDTCPYGPLYFSRLRLLRRAPGALPHLK